MRVAHQEEDRPELKTTPEVPEVEEDKPELKTIPEVPEVEEDKPELKTTPEVPVVLLEEDRPELSSRNQGTIPRMMINVFQDRQHQEHPRPNPVSACLAAWDLSLRRRSLSQMNPPGDCEVRSICRVTYSRAAASCGIALFKFNRCMYIATNK